MNQLAQVNIADQLHVPTSLRALTDVGKLVNLLLNNFMVVAGITFLILIIVAGYNMLSAAGNTQKYQQAMQIITTAVIGFVIVIGAYLIIRLVEVIANIHIVS